LTAGGFELKCQKRTAKPLHGNPFTDFGKGNPFTVQPEGVAIRELVPVTDSGPNSLHQLVISGPFG
jgi:hypothetical protein